MSRRIVVTGASGYVGKALVQRLSELDPNLEIVGLDKEAPRGESYDLRRVDLSEIQAEELAAILSGSYAIFHLAAARTDWGLDLAAYELDNVKATCVLVEAAGIAQIRRWIYFGTVGVYGPSEQPIDESAPIRPNTDYGRTKAAAESELLRVAYEAGWTIRVLRPSAVFSEEQPSNTNLYRLIEAIRRYRFVMIGDGSEIKTTSYLHNVVDAAVWLYQDLRSGGVKIYNYVDEPRLTTREMTRIICGRLRRRLPIVSLPLGLVERPARVLDWLGNRIGHDFPITAARIRKFCTPTNFDASLIRRDGFLPRFSTIEALERTVNWHRERSPTATKQGDF